MTTIAELTERRDRLQAELNDANKQLTDARLAAVGVREGDRVRDTQRGAVGIVCRVELWSDRMKPWVYAHLFKKDGSEGKREACFYDHWERVEP